MEFGDVSQLSIVEGGQSGSQTRIATTESACGRLPLTGWPDFCETRRVANTMKMHVLLGLVLAGVLCSCASNSPHSATMTGTQQSARIQAPLTPQFGPNRH